MNQSQPPQLTCEFTFDLQRFADLSSLTTDDSGAYLITSVDDLQILSAYVNEGNDTTDLTFKQTKDITFTTEDGNFTPIGNWENHFKGTYDGGNFKISNLKINGSDYQGLFGCVGNGGTVKDVHLVNANVSGNENVGGIVGENVGGTVSGITLDSEITGTTYNVGGLVGKNNDRVRGATSGNSVSGNSYYGDFVGYGKVMQKLYILTLPTCVTTETQPDFTSKDGVKYYVTGTKITLNGLDDGYFRGSDGKFVVYDRYKMPEQNSTIESFTPPTISANEGTLNFVVDNQDNGYYEISSADDLKVLSNYVNEGNDCADLTFKVMANIDIIDVAVLSNFAGTFDGCGHLLTNANQNIFGGATVSNLYYHGAATIDGATKVYTLELPAGVTASGAIEFDGNYYAIGNTTVTLTPSATFKTGYTFPESVTIDSDKTITATLDTANHYVFGNATDGYTLATVDNTTDYPDLVQVYELTLPDNVTAQGSIVVTDGGKTYAAGNITLTAAEGYNLSNITVNGTPDDDGVFTVNRDTNITADVTAIVEELNEYSAAGTAVAVKHRSGDFSTYSGVYSITASRENSTLVANAKNNTVIIAGGGENILTGGLGNDTFKFSAGGGIVTDYGIGATKNGDGTATTANGVDIVKVDGKVNGIYFERDGNTKKSATFTATIVYGDDNQVIVLKDIVKKPTKTGSSPIYQTNDIAAATLKIWDTSSGSKQSVLSAAKLKKLFHDDNDDSFTEILQAKTDYLVDISKGITPENNPFATQLALNSNKPKD